MRSFLTALLGGGVIGGLIAAYAANKYAQSRDRNTRRIEFIRLLGEWRTQVYQRHTHAVTIADFPEQVIRFGGAYVAIEPDLWCWRRSKFHAMCDEIIAMTDAEVEKRENELMGKAKLLGRIEAIIAFLT
jgi:hypothetical protein